ncbi:unnamed protein product [Plutella xylostella]|uniref:(diamondback moth) hypothetical protein n=1 Tax=Plutella xylostella TaxID=51655 RepID=A0A8S4GB03_PLUXY|nr:unnamed protein product [Plutella xylostella]
MCTGPKHCARNAFWCGERCVLPAYVCDGQRDCERGEDEAPALCGPDPPCHAPDKLNCSNGRCIPAAACCRQPLCAQPACCHLYNLPRDDGFDIEYPALFEDRHAPDDYGFIQSTIYTVTACALIFMIAVVLLVSAICKMHMKRAALRAMAQPPPRAQLYQTHRFPPCYEASRLLEQARTVTSAHASPSGSPTRNAPATQPAEGAEAEGAAEGGEGRSGLARLGGIFSSRYRQVPTSCTEVEMTDVRCASLNTSPTRPRGRLDNYRSPTYCDLNTTDFYFTSPEAADCGRDLNYMATPIEFFRRRTLSRSPLDRFIEQIERPRPLTLQLGRFQLSIPRFGRRSSCDLNRRPDTPNVAEINIDDLDFVRLNGNSETYTLNGRTIRLLGADFENYPTVLGEDTGTRPPPYNEAMRYKLYGPPPEYLSRDCLNTPRAESNGNPVDTEAATNVEMPPRYEDLASGVDNNANVSAAASNGNDISVSNVADNGNSLSAVIDNLPAIDCDVNANDGATVGNNGNIVINNG